MLKILCGASLSPTLQNKIQMAILQGIIDKNESISEDILEFIQKHYTMDDNIYSALINIMK